MCVCMHISLSLSLSLSLYIYTYIYIYNLCIYISAAWAVDQEFVYTVGVSGEVSNLSWLHFDLLWLSGVCSGLSRSTLRWI